MRLAITLTVLTASFVGAVEAEDTTKRSAELQVLDHFVGTWDVKVSVKAAGEEATTFEVPSIRRWSKGGRFVVFEDPQAEEFHMPITYDPESMTYPGVMMVGPSRCLVTGTWDADTQTMR